MDFRALTRELRQNAPVVWDHVLGLGDEAVDAFRWSVWSEMLAHVRHIRHGWQWRPRFANGWGASVIPDGQFGLEGEPQGEIFFEIAVTDHEGVLHYDTPITIDVLRRLTAEEAATVVVAISRLPPR